MKARHIYFAPDWECVSKLRLEFSLPGADSLPETEGGSFLEEFLFGDFVLLGDSPSMHTVIQRADPFELLFELNKAVSLKQNQRFENDTQSYSISLFFEKSSGLTITGEGDTKIVISDVRRFQKDVQQCLMNTYFLLFELVPQLKTHSFSYFWKENLRKAGVFLPMN